MPLLDQNLDGSDHEPLLQASPSPALAAMGRMRRCRRPPGRASHGQLAAVNVLVQKVPQVAKNDEGHYQKLAQEDVSFPAHDGKWNQYAPWGHSAHRFSSLVSYMNMRKLRYLGIANGRLT